VKNPVLQKKKGTLCRKTDLCRA